MRYSLYDVLQSLKFLAPFTKTYHPYLHTLQRQWISIFHLKIFHVVLSCQKLFMLRRRIIFDPLKPFSDCNRFPNCFWSVLVTSRSFDLSFLRVGSGPNISQYK